MNGVAVTFAVLEGIICTSGRCRCNVLSVRFPAPSDPPCCLFSSTHRSLLLMCSWRFSRRADYTRTSSHQKQASSWWIKARNPFASLRACLSESQPRGDFFWWRRAESWVPNCATYSHINVNVAVICPALRAAHSCHRTVGSYFAVGTFSVPVLAVMTDT